MRAHPGAGLRCTWSVRDGPQVSYDNDHAIPLVALHGTGHEDLLAYAERERRICDWPFSDNTMALAECSIASGGDDKHRCQRRVLIPHRTDSHQAQQTHGIHAHRLSLAEQGACPIAM
jgi:hypothetical protein